jgi:uncharacterized protein YndB with AHSA1/START domain
MADIVHDFFIKAPTARVFGAISEPSGLDQWWTKRASGTPQLGAEYQLSFAPEYDWRAVVSTCLPPFQFELQVTSAHSDWCGTSIGFFLEEEGQRTIVRFHHRDWPVVNEHYRVSCFCWAMYLRVLRRYLEHGEEVPYDARLDV